MDPCEKKPVDTLSSMGEQQREDITSSAQVRAAKLFFTDAFFIFVFVFVNRFVQLVVTVSVCFPSVCPEAAGVPSDP